MAAEILVDGLKRLSTTFSKTPSQQAFEREHPTLDFPEPPIGTRSLCKRCLTLLSHVITHFGDGSRHGALDLHHSASLPDPSDPSSPPSISSCIICKKTKYFFDVFRKRTAMEEHMRASPLSHWSLKWKIDTPKENFHDRWKFPVDEFAVILIVTHFSERYWRMGGFDLYLDFEANRGRQWKQRELYEGEDLTADYPCITSLDRPSSGKDDGEQNSELDFFSTFGDGTISSAHSWMLECLRTHEKCKKVFGDETSGSSSQAWHPDRLVRVQKSLFTDETGQDTVRLHAYIAEKAGFNEFPPETTSEQLTYLSLSHCWGPSQNPTAPLGGRVDTVLTQAKLRAWKRQIPLSTLPKTFTDAVTVCAILGFEYIWIDSLCIIQDSTEDWHVQSATMGDVYKYAWMNIAALKSVSDYDGFINQHRDPRVEFGFRASFATILGRSLGEVNDNGQECVLLRGQAKLKWRAPSDNTETNPQYLPLFQRAWVYQERCLSKRTLAFTDLTVYFTCDESTHAECSASSHLTREGLRSTLQSTAEIRKELNAMTSDSTPAQANVEPMRRMLREFDSRWHSCISSYTRCRLTYPTDKLIAFSAIARDLAAAGMILNTRYLAGLWEVNLPFQMAWMAVEGKSTPRRKRLGEEGYVAPSWSWASVETSVLPRQIFPLGNMNFALADVLSADVVLETDYVYGSVKAGWMRMRGRLNRIKSASAIRSPSLLDQATNAKLWFTPDTVEGYELLNSLDIIEKVVWMPLTIRIDDSMVDAKVLVLVEVPKTETDTYEFDFVKPDDKFYRRIGTGNFGRIPSKLRMDVLLLRLGTFPDIEAAEGSGRRLANGFERSEEGFEDFVLV